MNLQLNKFTHFYNSGYIPDKYHVIFRLIVGVTYTFLVIRILIGKKFLEFSSLNNALYPQAIRWILFFCFLLVLNSIFSLLSKFQIYFFNKPEIIYEGNWMTLSLLFTFNSLILYAVFNPVILFGLPHFTNTVFQANADFKMTSILNSFGNLQNIRQIVEEPETVALTHSKKTTNQPAKSSQKEQLIKGLEEDIAYQQLFEYLEMHMAKQQPFLHKECNTFTLSKELNVPQHHLSYLFKYVLKKSFVDYRNEWRVNYVIDSFKKGKHKEFTMETIGINAGFNSKSAFFIDFKKHTGKSPMQYLSELDENA